MTRNEIWCAITEDEMKISSIAVHPLSAATDVPLSTAHETFRTSHFILVEVKTDDGLTGYGKVHGEPMKTICERILRFGEIVKGMDALGHAEVWEKLFLLTCPRPGGIQGSGGLPPPLPRGARGHIMAAIAGIDIALWDITGKAAGLPVYKLLGGARQPVRARRRAAPSRIPLAHGERQLTRFTMRDFIASCALRFAQFAATRYAGFTEGLRVAQLAEQYGVRIAPHLAPEIHAHLCLAFPSASFAVETIRNKARDVLGPGVYKHGPRVSTGEVHINDAAGVGIENDWDFVSR